MIFAKCILGSFNKIVALNQCRNIQTTQVLELQVTVNRLRRMGTRSQGPLMRRRQLKDSELIDMNDAYGEDSIRSHPNFLEETYEKQMRELKNETKKINKIIMKKSFAKRPKEPNMLTFNERQHIRFLHESDPVEWSPEQLSESFPALPWAIRSILKNKWVPDNEDKIKIMDEAVFQNWEKLKQNKLEASKELLEHLKKFIDKRENLEVQLKNPNFFHLPEMKKKLTWKSGKLNSFLLKYEKEVNELRGNPMNVKLLMEKAEGNENARIYSVDAMEKGTKLVNDKNFEGKSLLLEDGTKVRLQFGKEKREKQVTLEVLKKNIFEKVDDNNNDLILPSEEAIIQKMLMTKRHPSEYDSGQRKIFPEKNEPKRPETKSKSPNGILDDSRLEVDNSIVTRESQRGGEEEGGRGRGRRRRRNPSLEKENLHKETKGTKESEVYPNTFEITELGRKLYGVKEGKRETAAVVADADDKKNVDVPRIKITEKKRPEHLNYFNTEKDKQIYENHEKLLSETVFWKSRKKNRSLDAGFPLVGSGTGTSPHIASHIQTYFTYDYPLKIDIPKDKREKGKLYKVKDCYYDDKGLFLYRVPGMSE